MIRRLSPLSVVWLAVVLLSACGGADPLAVTSTGAASEQGPRVGEVAPLTSLASTAGGNVDLAGFRGQRNILLYFYEHAG